MNRTKIVLVTFIVISTFFNQCLADGQNIVTQLFSQVETLFSDKGGLVPKKYYHYLLGEGFSSIATNRAFSQLCISVSNNVSQITDNWTSYCSNEVVRFSVLNACCYSGSECYTNFTMSLCSEINISSTTEEWESVSFLVSPYGTPLERYLIMNYNTPGISNIVERILTVSRSRHDDSITEICEGILSGAAKTEYEEDRDAGVL